MKNKSVPYQSLIVSRIPVHCKDNVFYTDPLWALDINANAEAVSCLRLICPVQSGDRKGYNIIDPRIEVIDSNNLDSDTIDALVEKSDVIELPGNFDWANSTLTRRVMRAAKRHDRLTVLGISSNRMKTTLMNAAGKPLPSRIRSWLKAQSIRISLDYLVSRCDAVRIVGMGLHPLVAKRAKTVLVETASWISLKDILPARNGQLEPISLVIASRLEPMKGVGIGIKAMAKLLADGHDLTMNVIGVGADEEKLKTTVNEYGISKKVTFSGKLGYPEPFFAAIRHADYVLMTNLNDEQPRLIFDAIAQGAIPVCPRNHAYKELNLDPDILYEQGSAEDLFRTLGRLINLAEDSREKIRVSLREFAKANTLESMHARRRDWVLSLLA